MIQSRLFQPHIIKHADLVSPDSPRQAFHKFGVTFCKKTAPAKLERFPQEAYVERTEVSHSVQEGWCSGQDRTLPRDSVQLHEIVAAYYKRYSRFEIEIMNDSDKVGVLMDR